MTPRPLRIGLIARSDNSGLGIQTYNFYKHMEPTKTMVVDISMLNSNDQYPERYPERSTFVKGIPTSDDIDTFLDGLDCVFVAEAPYNYHLYRRARELGVKTVAQYNYEFFDWYAYPNFPKPDMLIAPSKWHYNDVQRFCDENNIKHVYLHCPVDRKKLRFSSKKQAKLFLHTVGKSAAHDRNGTETVIDAVKLLKSDAKIKIHFQGNQGLSHQATSSYDDYLKRLGDLNKYPNLKVLKYEYEMYQNIYDMADVLLLPRRYGGNCLPMNEALSCGIPVIMPDISPNNQFLPNNWLIPAEKIGEFTPRTTIDIYGSEPQDLANKIDEMYENGIEMDNEIADVIAGGISWTIMKPKYLKVLEELCR